MRIFYACFLLIFAPFINAKDWPQFRGAHAAGVDDSGSLPLKFDGPSGQNVLWKQPIPGLSHSGPIVWGNRVIVATAAGSQDDPELKLGLYGSGDAAKDMGPHRWMLLCFDKKTGKSLWQKTLHESKPRAKRHIKATHCNATPATNGKYIVAMMGSEGLFCTDMNGKLKWRVDLGRLDVGAYDVPSYEWGPASSPIIFEGKAIVQCDQQGEDFIAAFDLASGKEVWRTKRDELPSWGTPTVYVGSRGTELVANGSNFIMGYNPKTGEELWRLGGSSQITAPTPVFTDDLIVVASGRRPVKPVFAVRPGARGDITLASGETSSKHVAWSHTKVGPYMPTPIIYRGLVYTLGNDGILTCYDLQTGKRKYRKRVSHGGSGFSASPVAGGGHLYLPGEAGDVLVVKAGTEYADVGTSELGETLMATPAISESVLYFRARHHLFAIGK
ncbi:MAG: PQQ-binding-like beta-propeller repeat protein [Acidobacteriota bacterium]|nr:PQQ-binding-like beta-propeller repeat protein [Acidobacteriota bacterium]